MTCKYRYTNHKDTPCNVDLVYFSEVLSLTCAETKFQKHLLKCRHSQYYNRCTLKPEETYASHP